MLYYRVLYSLTRSLRPAWLHATAQFFAMHSSPCSTLLLHSTLNNNKTRSIRGQCGLRSGTCNCIQFPSFFLSKAHCGQARKGAWEERALFFSQAVSFTSFSFFVPEPVQLCGHVKTQRRDILNGALCAPVFFVVAFFPFLYLLHCRGSRLLNYMKGLSSTTKNSSRPVFTKCKTFSPAKHPYKHCKPLKISREKLINSSFCILNNKLQRLEKINKIVLANKHVRDQIWHCWCGVITLHFMANSFVRAPHHYILSQC